MKSFKKAVRTQTNVLENELFREKRRFSYEQKC